MSIIPDSDGVFLAAGHRAVRASEQARTEAKARGWVWVASEFRRVRDDMRAESLRLLGPDRGE